MSKLRSAITGRGRAGASGSASSDSSDAEGDPSAANRPYRRQKSPLAAQVTPAYFAMVWQSAPVRRSLSEDLCFPTLRSVRLCRLRLCHKHVLTSTSPLSGTFAALFDHVIVCAQQPVVDPFDEVFGSRGSSPDRPPRQQPDQQSDKVTPTSNIPQHDCEVLLCLLSLNVWQQQVPCACSRLGSVPFLGVAVTIPEASHDTHCRRLHQAGRVLSGLVLSTAAPCSSSRRLRRPLRAAAPL